MISSRPTLASVILLGLLCLLSTPTRAVGEIATTISIEPLETLTVGADARVTTRLATGDGAVIVDEPITLTIDGDSRPRRWTDAEGVAAFRLPRDLLPGTYEVVASYAGRTGAYLGATARIEVEIVPYELSVDTVPPLPGMVFEIDGTRFEAGADGVARVGLDRLGEHTLTVVPDAYRHPQQRVEFSRWSSEDFGPTITIRAPLRVKLQAGFDVSYEASLEFVDPHGDLVDQARIDEVTLRNSVGAELTSADGQPRWYKAIRTIRRPAGLETVPVRYSVEGVTVDGANVVNVGQQRFGLEPGSVWSIEVLLYSVRLVPNDALFGFPVGGSVVLTYPSGATARSEVANGEVAANGLARGLYHVKLEGAPGWSPVTPIALSRDQEVRIRVITYADVAVVLMLGLSAALALLHIGRPHLAPAVVAGARGVVGTVRNPRSMGAFIARRRTAGPVPEMAPAMAQSREFVLPHPRTTYAASSIPNEPYRDPPPVLPRPQRAVPIAQVIRSTLLTPLPATGPEESAAAARSPLAAAADVSTPAPITQPARSVLVPAIAVAKPLSVAAAVQQPAEGAAAPTRRKAAGSEPTGGVPKKPRRTRPRGPDAAPKQPRTRRTTTTEAAVAAVAPVRAASKARRSSTKKGASGSDATNPAGEPGTGKPPRAKPAAAKSAKRSTPTAVAPTPSAEPAETKRRGRAKGPGVSDAMPASATSAGATTTKPRARTKAAKSDEPRVSKKSAASKARSAATDAGGAKRPKSRSAATDAGGAKRPKSRSAALNSARRIELAIEAVERRNAEAAIRLPGPSSTAAGPAAPDRWSTDAGPVVRSLVTDVVGSPQSSHAWADGTGGERIEAIAKGSPPPPTESGRLARMRGRSERLCTVCGTPMPPGARHCRRCGRASVVGTLARQRQS